MLLSADVRLAEPPRTVGADRSHLILQVRHATPGLFVRGDRVVLIEYLSEENAYRVISAEEFDAL